MKNVIFFSKSSKDVHSPELIKLIKESPFVNHFHFYCTDPDPQTRKRNTDLLEILEIEKVPTMYVNGQKYVGLEESLDWLQNAYEHQLKKTNVQKTVQNQTRPFYQQQTQGSMQQQRPPQQQMQQPHPHTMMNQPTPTNNNNSPELQGLMAMGEDFSNAAPLLENFNTDVVGEDWITPQDTKLGSEKLSSNNGLDLESVREQYLQDLRNK